MKHRIGKDLKRFATLNLRLSVDLVTTSAAYPITLQETNSLRTLEKLIHRSIYIRSLEICVSKKGNIM